MTRVLALAALAFVAESALLPSESAAQACTVTTECPPTVVFTERVEQKAAELDHDPVRIYEFVRNELEYQVYYGYMKGPDGTLASGGGNEFDLAALLVSLLRASEIPARFVIGRARFANEDVVPLTGAIGEPPNAPHQGSTRYWRTAQPFGWIGTPNGPIVHGYPDNEVEVWHAWVEAQVPMAQYRGAGGDLRDPAWVPLAPSFKLRERQDGIDLPFETEPSLTIPYLDDGAGLYEQILPEEIHEQVEDRIQAWLAVNEPGKGLADVPRFGPIVPERTGVVPTALPFGVEGTPVRFPGTPGLPALVPSAYYSVGFVVCDTALTRTQCLQSGLAAIRDEQQPDPGFVPDPAVLATWWDYAPAVDGKRVTLTFPPVDPSSVPEDGYASCPAVATQPTLRIDGGPGVALGTAVNACDDLFVMVLAFGPWAGDPADGVYKGAPLASDHRITAEGTYLLHLDFRGAGAERTRAAAETLVAVEASWPIVDDGSRVFVDSDGNGSFDAATEKTLAQDFDAQEELVGSLLYLASVRYQERLRDAWKPLEGYYHRLPGHAPMTGMLRSASTINYLFDAPFGTQPGGLLIDIKGATVLDLLSDGKKPDDIADDYGVLKGFVASESEHRIWEEVTGIEAVSTVRGMQLLSTIGEEILEIRSQADAIAAFDAASCRMDVYVDGSGPEFFSPGDDISSLVAPASQGDVIDGGCQGMDLSTYCELKVRYSEQGDDQAWRAPGWDAVCPDVTLSSAPDELWIARNSRFIYRDWDGHVYFTRKQDEAGYIIQVFGLDPAGGGYGQNSSVVGPDPFSLELVPEEPDQSLVEQLVALGMLAPEDSGEASVIADLNLTVQSTLAENTLAPDRLAADPVSVINGNFHHVVTDLEVPGRGGFDLRLVRSYNSRLEHDGTLGHGWMHTFDQHLRIEPGTPNDRIVFVSETGAETTFFDRPTGFLVDAWVRKKLERKPGGGYVLTEKDGSKLHFLDEAGGLIARLDYLEDRNGNQIQVGYVGGVLDTVTYAPGRQLQFTMDGPYIDQIELVIDSVVYGTWDYDVENGDLVKYFDPVQTAKAQPKAVEYDYLTGQADPKLDHNLRELRLPADRPVEDPPAPGGAQWTMTFDYWANDMVRSHTDALGRTTYFDYNFIDKRTRVTHPDGAVDTHVFDRNANIVRRESPRGGTVRREYDPDTHEPTRTVDPLGNESQARYDARGNPVWIQDREGHVQTFLYNRFSQPTRHVDARGAERRWEYDDAGNLLRHWAEVAGELELLSSYEYDGFGNPTKSCVYAEPGAGRPECTRFEYDDDGVALERQVDALGNVTRYRTDPLGRTVEIEAPRTKVDGSTELVRSRTEYDALNRVVTSIDPAGLVRRTVYDDNGQVEKRQTETAAGTRDDETNVYDAGDQLTSTTNALDDTTSFRYDARGRVVETRTPLGRTSRVEYDLDGNVVAEIDPTGARWERFYDASGRLIERRDPSTAVATHAGFTGGVPESDEFRGAKSLRFSYDREGRLTQTDEDLLHDDGTRTSLRMLQQIFYDPAGNPVQVYDAAYNLTEVEFDELGRQISVTTPKGVAGEEGTTVFEYDLAGRLVARTDPEQNTTRVAYDLLGRVSDLTDPLGRTSYRRYDEVGNLVQTEDGAGRIVDLEYDARGYLIRREGDTTDTIAAYTYDKLGRQIRAVDQSGSGMTADYDALDRPIALHHPLAGTARRVYDADGRIGQVVYPDDPTYGFPSGIVVSYLYDARGQLAGIHDPTAGLWQFAYDEAGRLIRRKDPSASGLEQQIRYRPEGFVHEIALREPDGTEHERLHFETYDVRGNPERFHTLELGLFVETNVQYDARGQITRVDYPDTDGITVFAEEFGYDLARNRVRHVGRDGVARTHVVDAANQLDEILDEATGAPLVDFAYDDAGRRVARTEAGVTGTYTYDGLGRLVALDPDDANAGDETTFAYDPADHRSAWTSPSDARTFFGEWLELHGALPAATTKRLVHGGGIDRVVGEIDEFGTVRSLFADAGKNVTHVAEFGAVAFAVEGNPRRYEAFGALREGSSAVDRGFAGRPYEGDTGLVYLRARHYDPETGRFLQSDPLGLAADHLYAYARNNPYVYGDPLGLDPEATSEPGKPVDRSSIEAKKTGTTVSGRQSAAQQSTSEPVNGIHEMSNSVASVSTQTGGILGMLGITEAQRTGAQLALAGAGAFPILGIFPDAINIAVDALAFDPTALAIDLGAAVPGYGLAAAPLAVGLRAGRASNAVHVVYRGIDKAGTVRYVGRTSRGVPTRAAEHIASGGGKENLVYFAVEGGDNLSLLDARVMEQQLINEFGLETLLNKINSVSPKYWDDLGIAP